MEFLKGSKKVKDNPKKRLPIIPVRSEVRNNVKTELKNEKIAVKRNFTRNFSSTDAGRVK